MIDSIQGRMRLLFASFIILVLLSASATFALLDAHNQDAQVINIAGRQRMLIQQTARLALEFEQDGELDHLVAIKETIAIFERTLMELESGGNPENSLPSGVAKGETNQAEFTNAGFSLPPTHDAQILHQLGQVKAGWNEYKTILESLLEPGPRSPDKAEALSSLRSTSESLILEADQLVMMYEASSTAKVERLRLVQLAFLVGSVVVFGLGGVLTQIFLFRPVKQLSYVAARIGNGDLYTPIAVYGPKEIQVLSTVFEKMRVSLKESRQELMWWAERLEKQVEERTQELEALFSVSRDITCHLELPDVLQSVTDQACRLLGGEAAFLCLLDEEGNALKLHAHSGDTAAILKSTSPACNFPAAKVLSGDQAIYCGKEGCMDRCQIISPEFRASHLVAPLRIGDKNRGALCISSKKQDTLSNHSCEQLVKLAHVGVVALENARLYQQAERTAMLEERQRIAADMHDGLAQSISAIQMSIGMAKRQIELGKIERAVETLSQSRMSTEQAIQDVRKAISSLQEDHPVSVTLQEQLACLASEFSSSECEVRWKDSVAIPIVLAHQESEQVSRVIREALLNARSHGKSSVIKLRLAFFEGKGIIFIEDNGQGFDPQKHLLNTQNGRHFGIKIMKARAARIGGSLEIRSSIGNGTRVSLTWPIGSSYGKGG
jgi:two-component system, NarL family, nitrate/nitrite sensor histidine kinase NarX